MSAVPNVNRPSIVSFSAKQVSATLRNADLGALQSRPKSSAAEIGDFGADASGSAVGNTITVLAIPGDRDSRSIYSDVLVGGPASPAFPQDYGHEQSIYSLGQYYDDENLDGQYDDNSGQYIDANGDAWARSRSRPADGLSITTDATFSETAPAPLTPPMDEAPSARRRNPTTNGAWQEVVSDPDLFLLTTIVARSKGRPTLLETLLAIISECLAPASWALITSDHRPDDGGRSPVSVLAYNSIAPLLLRPHDSDFQRLPRAACCSPRSARTPSIPVSLSPILHPFICIHCLLLRPRLSNPPFLSLPLLCTRLFAPAHRFSPPFLLSFASATDPPSGGLALECGSPRCLAGRCLEPRPGRIGHRPIVHVPIGSRAPAHAIQIGFKGQRLRTRLRFLSVSDVSRASRRSPHDAHQSAGIHPCSLNTFVADSLPPV